MIVEKLERGSFHTLASQVIIGATAVPVILTEHKEPCLLSIEGPDNM